MSDKRQKNQRRLAFMAEGGGETPMAVSGGTEPPVASAAGLPDRQQELTVEILSVECAAIAAKGSP